MSGVTIRKAKAKDIEAMIALLRLLFSLEEDFTFCPGQQRIGLEMMLKNDRGILLVAEKNTEIIGMCSGQLIISTAEGGLSLLVEDVVVDKSRQGKGVGTALLSALQDWGTKKKVARLQLLADRSNSPALKFYHTRQWHQTKLVCLCKRPTTTSHGEYGE